MGFRSGTRLAPFADPFVCPAALSLVTAPSLPFFFLFLQVEYYRISIVLGAHEFGPQDPE